MYPDDPEPIATAHLLVIDGDDAILADTRDRLEAAGFRVTIADLPDIGIVRRVVPDVIVVGVFYRGEPGALAFLEYNATDAILARVPVIVRVPAIGLAPVDRERLGRLAQAVISVDDHTGLLAQLDRLLAPVGG